MKNKDEIPLAAQFGQQLGIVATKYSALVARLLEPHSLTLPQLAVLIHLVRRGEASRVSDIAKAVELTQSAVTKIVQKFDGHGLVTIARDQRDGRNKPVQITPQGAALLGAVQRSFGPAFAQLLDGWTPARVEAMIADLSALGAALDRMR